jgi:uncharacterized protein with FMN-binding domain
MSRSSGGDLLMKRIVYWLLSTVTVVVLLFGYRTSLAGPLPTTQATVAAAPSPTESSPGSSARTVAGTVAQTQWGPVQVEVTVEDGKVTDVSVPRYPDGNPRDQQINAYALPILVQETLDAQSADIDMVSGATVTSDGYRRSLQAALDEAGL